MQIEREYTVGAVSSYFTLIIPWEPNPERRSVWHPTERTGPLSRGAFPSVDAAVEWAAVQLGRDARYTLRECPVFQ